MKDYAPTMKGGRNTLTAEHQLLNRIFGVSSAVVKKAREEMNRVIKEINNHANTVRLEIKDSVLLKFNANE
jgi:hypothetical protein